jgi:hypothetical protein
MAAYQGTDRRRHRVFVTRNTEYHFRDGVCIAVRDRASKKFQRAHIALALKLGGRVRLHPDGIPVPHLGEPEPGDALFFNRRNAEGHDRQIVTSRVESVGRPPKRDVLSYPSLRAKP